MPILTREILKEVSTTSCMPSVPPSPETKRDRKWKRQVRGKNRFSIPGVFANHKAGFAK